MAFKKIRRAFCAVALAGVAVTVPMLTGCNTDHPEAKITLQYEGVEYVLNYKMYRNMYPQTVQHFIELTDNGFYNNTIVHNYQSSNLYCGGYSYREDGETNEEEGKLSYSQAYSEGEDGLRDYLDAVSKEKEYQELASDTSKITPSVYSDFIGGKYVDPRITLIGEFSSNQHKIDNGALKNSYGALKMYYSSKTDVKERVYLDKYGSEPGVMGEYRYNRATSLFSIYTGSSTSTDSSYCIFATLKNTETLESLKAAIARSLLTDEVKLYVDYFEKNPVEETYRITRTAIIVKSVVITKY